ncbi:Transposon Ty3-I Gag-Pol polyprotein,Transposon Ty3-G Gag-Pol polyprotein,Retrovirus-related Pol polyprotein from transposon 17.6 [Mytilus coruscus]|uniref:Transposon Ty3-I Gag-Pol polyprotein,Transposon Ty3-G Gag-Pol polyprotein,Retrovirus-related Pol polyprotein from transposon 17.6 n=1 Tax=Mytilus coruscus TaxID=42192 RepID=A0A6J8AZU9_MYTCO|nr:Transposon Ty3-I Gag-Pol polyprotein,Transposon Ty3-G Gag-Pol polyprotein,Retrovirus-related Pol polyprotein from transposon 17.6 [Mytilus coruscus]
MDSIGDNLTSHKKQEVARLLVEFKNIIAKNDDDLGCFFLASSVKLRLAKQSQFLLQSEIVVPIHSEWSAPVVLVRKKDGGIRWCIDYRKIIAVTSKDLFPLPNIEECMDTLAGASVFFTLDLQSGYHQIDAAPEDRVKTAFTTRYGLFEYTRMPFGLCGAPGTFQRVMELVLRGLQWEIVLIYLDDVIIASPDFDSHISHLTQLFEIFRDHGLKLKPIKYDYDAFTDSESDSSRKSKSGLEDQNISYLIRRYRKASLTDSLAAEFRDELQNPLQIVFYAKYGCIGIGIVLILLVSGYCLRIKIKAFKHETTTKSAILDAIVNEHTTLLKNEKN